MENEARPVRRAVGARPSQGVPVLRRQADGDRLQGRATLGTFLSERGKIIPARITGNCARHQRRLTAAIKQARTVALLPYTTVYP